MILRRGMLAVATVRGLRRNIELLNEPRNWKGPDGRVREVVDAKVWPTGELLLIPADEMHPRPVRLQPALPRPAAERFEPLHQARNRFTTTREPRFPRTPA